MRLRRYLCFVLFLATVDLLAQHPHADRPSVHGMLVFGTEKIYASHLPMFRSPHDYQIILELQFSQIDRAAFFADQERHPEEFTYTLAPERFVLPEFIANPRPFKGVLYRGHFERGGKPISDSIEVTLAKIIYSSRLDRTANRSPDTSYLIFGNEREQFAAHILSAAPDFDNLLRVMTSLPVTHAALTISLGSKKEVPSLSGSMHPYFTSDNKQIRIQWLKQLYLEFDDLK